MKYIYIILIAVLLPKSILAQENGLMVIVNNDNKTISLTNSKLKSILLGRRVRWKDKSKIILALMKPDTPLGKKIAPTYVSISSDDLSKLHLRLEFAGRITPPNLFSDVEELIDFVRKTPGSVGIISDEITLDGVKRLTLD